MRPAASVDSTAAPSGAADLRRRVVEPGDQAGVLLAGAGHAESGGRGHRQAAAADQQHRRQQVGRRSPRAPAAGAAGQRAGQHRQAGEQDRAGAEPGDQAGRHPRARRRRSPPPPGASPGRSGWRRSRARFCMYRATMIWKANIAGSSASGRGWRRRRCGSAGSAAASAGCAAVAWRTENPASSAAAALRGRACGSSTQPWSAGADDRVDGEHQAAGDQERRRARRRRRAGPGPGRPRAPAAPAASGQRRRSGG